jgi:hypothetical protein
VSNHVVQAPHALALLASVVRHAPPPALQWFLDWL